MMKRPTRFSRQRSVFQAMGLSFLASAAITAASSLISAKPAIAQQTPSVQRLECDAHEKITKHLGLKYTEAPRSLGLATNGKVLQVFSTEGGETWTMVMTAPEGLSCIVAAGKYWHHLPVEPKGPEA